MRTGHHAGSRSPRFVALTSASMLAMAITTPSVVLAQEAGERAVEEVVVTGSRAITNGASAPTPVTVVSVQQLQAAAPTGAVTTPRSANGNRYDFVGRYVTAGLKFNF